MSIPQVFASLQRIIDRRILTPKYYLLSDGKYRISYMMYMEIIICNNCIRY